MHRPWQSRLFAALLGAVAPVLVGSTPAKAQVSVQVGVEIGSYPRLTRVPGYPVYYSPGAPANLFFYDGAYWLYVDDAWYTSSWYNGPWFLVVPYEVPLFLLRVPVRYYPVPPPYFRAWRAEAPPRWGEHWGPAWAQRRRGWDHWDPRKAPPPAPLPVYQRHYGGERYPASPEEQQRLQTQQYRYRPRDPQAQGAQRPVTPPAAVQPIARPAPVAPPAIEHRREGLQRPVAPPPQEAWPPHGAAPGRPYEVPHAPHEAPHEAPHAAPRGDPGHGPAPREPRGRER